MPSPDEIDNPIPRLLTEARRSFRTFYDIATPDDRTWFDALVLGHWALNQGVSAPRENMPNRDSFEKAVDETERKFLQARDYVRACPTFAKLEQGHQTRIADILFEPFPPWGLPNLLKRSAGPGRRHFVPFRSAAGGASTPY